MSLAISPSFPFPQYCSSPAKSARISQLSSKYPASNCPSPIKPATPTYSAHTVQVNCSIQFQSNSCIEEGTTESSQIGLLTFILEGSCLSELESYETQNCYDDSLEPSIKMQDSECSLRNRYPHLFQSFLAPSSCTDSKPSPLTSTRNTDLDKRSAGNSDHPSNQKKRAQKMGLVKSVITSLRRLNRRTSLPYLPREVTCQH